MAMLRHFQNTKALTPCPVNKFIRVLPRGQVTRQRLAKQQRSGDNSRYQATTPMFIPYARF